MNNLQHSQGFDNFLLSAALEYAHRGWPVIPLHTPVNGQCSCGRADCGGIGKHPRTPHGLKNATTDETNIQQWWTQWPAANVGVLTGKASGFVVLDIDPRHGGDQTLADLEIAHGKVPDTVSAFTGGGGRHLLLKHPGFPIKNDVGKALGAGVDIRGEGGYIVAPPSLHAHGQRYAWEAGRAPEDMTPAPAPEWLLSLATTRQIERHTSQNGHRVIPEGQRNDVLFRNGCAMRGRGFGYDAILAALLQENEHCCQPPLDPDEVERIAESASKYEPADEQPLHPHAKPQSRRGDNSSNSFYSYSELPWPVLDPRALHGLAGDVVRALRPYTEADDAALLVQFLLSFGNVIDRRPHCLAEADYHALNEFAVLVGSTSKGRKGTSMGHIRKLFLRADPEWVGTRLQAGLSSGEGLIWAVRDPIVKTEAVREKGRPTGEYQEVMADVGVTDKRLLALEAEMASTLRVLGREGNTLSAIIRQAWDSGTLRVLTKNSPAVATNAHISIVGHITKDELLRYLDSTEAGNGFGNRFLWCCVKRSKFLPDGGKVPDDQMRDLASRLTTAVQCSQTVDLIERDDAARAMWHRVYPALSEGAPGLLGSMTSRAEAHVMRLSALYALLDQSPVVKTEHLTAALALWEYCEASAKYIFGESLGDPLADEILRILRAKTDGMTKTEISNHFGRNRSSAQLTRALNALLEKGLVACETQQTEGRSAEVWKAVGAPGGVREREGDLPADLASASAGRGNEESTERQAGERAPFTPSPEWQEVPRGTEVPPGGEYRLNLETNTTEARWPDPPDQG